MGLNAFKIAHFSDLHLTADDSAPRSEPRLFGKLKGMNRAFRGLLADGTIRRCDLLLVTGDVTDRGDAASWSLFWREIEQADFKKRCLVLPGNHDVCHLGWVRAGERRQLMEQDLAKATHGLEKGCQKTCFPWMVQPHPRLAVFGLQSSNPGNQTAASNAVGALGFAQLEALARLLHRHAHVPFKIVAMHHSPNIPREETEIKRNLSRMSRLERWGMEVPEAERRALRLLCIATDVTAIVHGHLHRREDRRVNGVRIIGTPATTEPVTIDGTERYSYFEYRLGKKNLRAELKSTVL